MVQMIGWGSRCPLSNTSGISLAGIMSYGLAPNVISSQTVTPEQERHKSKIRHTAKRLLTLKNDNLLIHSMKTCNKGIFYRIILQKKVIKI